MAQINEIDFYSKAGELTGLHSWEDAKQSLFGIDILTILKTKRKYSMAIEWFKIQGWEPVTCDLQFELLILAFCEQKDLISLTNLLLNTEQIEVNVLSIVEKVLNNVSDFDYRVFLIEFIFKHFSNRLTEETTEYYNNYMIGIQLIKGLDTKIQDNYLNIITKPMIICEQMIMNLEYLEYEVLEVAAKVLNFDCLLETYAQKAVDIQIYDIPSAGSVVSDATLISSTFLDIKSTPKTFLMPESVPTKEEWIPDSNVSNCMLCKYEKFSMLNRKHHCRRCGRVICANCSQNSLVIREIKSNSLVRVCDECYIQTQKINRKESLSSESSSGINRQIVWVLTPDELHNDSIRMEFYYDSSPSVTMCLALLKLHSDKSRCCKVIVDLICKSLLETVVSSQVDNGLVIGMIRSLLVSTRISIEEQNPELKERLNFTLDRLDVIRMLINSNCITKEMISYALSTNDNAIRKLQERLIEMERFELARDLATKLGLESKSIFKTWAFQCLKHSQFSEARDKFKHVFDKKTTEVNRDLENIVNVLSKRKYWSNSSVREKCLQISKGKFNSSDSDSSIFFTDSNDLQTTNLKAFSEIMYYLREYGSNDDIIKFYIKQSMFRQAIQLFLNYLNSYSNNFFMKELFMPSVRKGFLSIFLRELRSCDPGLSRVWRYLLAACKYLSSNDMFNVLHVLQVFMGDHLRAAITQINCFLSPSAVDYMQLNSRIESLQTAKQHCSDFLSLNASDYRTGCLIMDREDVMKQIRALNIQIDITIRFNEKKIKGFLPNDVISLASDNGTAYNSPPTILDHNRARKTELTALTAIAYGSQIADGFSISQMIIKDHNLDSAQVYRLAARALVRTPTINVIESVSQLLGCIRASNTGDTTLCDDVIGACIRSSNDPVLSENLIKLLSNDINKIDAYIRNDKLRSAYMLALKHNRATDVTRVLEAAKRLNDTQMMKVCDMWLKKRTKHLPNDD